MRRLLLFVLATSVLACSSSATEPCTLLIKGTLLARLKHFDANGKVIKVDSLYADPKAVADTFRICGGDTTKISVTKYKFSDE